MLNQLKQLCFIIQSVILLSIVSRTVSRNLPCPLVWVRVSYGEIPSNAANPVFSTTLSKEHAIARIIKDDGTFVGGRAEISSGRGYFIDRIPQKALISSEYEVLTNPNSCILGWTSVKSSLIVRTSGDLYYVARTSIKTGEILTSEVYNNQQSIKILETSGSIITYDEFEYLESYIKGLKLEVKNFSFNMDQELAPEVEVLGVDEIQNRAPVKASQLLSHRSTFKEIYTFRSMSSWGSTTSWNFGFDLKIPIPLSGPVTLNINLGLDVAHSSSDSNEETQVIHKEEEKEIFIEREIHVGPYESVQACSTSTSLKDFKLTYSAVDKYSAQGFSGEEVQSVLIEDGILNGEIDGETVLVQRDGMFEGSLSLTTRFLVLPFNIKSKVGGCTDLYNKLNLLKKLRKSNSARRHDLENEVYSIVYGNRTQ